MRGRGFLLSVLLIALGALLAAPSGARAAADFGDAPDGANAGYAGAPGVVGGFPSKAASPGPQHSPFGSFFLGGSVNGEADSAQVDKDLFDDGAQATLTACGSSTLKVVLNAAGLSPALRTSAHTAYVNAWFDWNRDGDWKDPSDGCRAEWAIQNLPVDMSALAGGGVAVLPIGLTAGNRSSDLWYRVTLTLDQPAIDPTGAATSPYNLGETEDYLIPAGGKHKPILPPLKGKKKKKKKKGGGGGGGGKKGKGKFKVSCVPNPAVILHGGTAMVSFAIMDTGKGLIFGTVTANGGAAGKMKLIPRKPQPKGVPPGFVVVDAFTFTSTHVDPPTRVQTVTLKFFFSRGNQTQNLSCAVVIVHIDFELPRIVCGNACAGLVQQLPPVPPVSLNATWQNVPIEIVQLQLQSVQPVSGFKLPLQSQSPPWPTAELRNTNDPTTNCRLGTIRPEGGPAALVCNRPPAPINSFFDIFADLDPPPSSSVLGEVTLGGQEFSFIAPHL